MNKNYKIILTGFIILVLIGSVIVVGTLLKDSQNIEPELERLFTFPIGVGEKTFAVTVLTNYSSSPEVSYWEEGKSVYVVFTGNKENSFFNVTVPTDLIWGEMSLINKYYIVDKDYYIQSYNVTHNSIYFTFDQSAYVKHFEIRGTKAATSDSS